MNMKYIFFLGLGLTSLLFVNCSKDKTPAGFITAECPDTIKFNAQILPIISNNCFSCHDAAGAQAPTLSDYGTISANAEKIIKALKGEGAPQMPQGSPALHDSLIQQFECWVNQGKLNN